MRFHKDKDHSDKSIDYMFIEEGIIMGIHGENPPLMKTRKKIDIGDYYSDYSKINELLEWHPSVNIREGLRKTLDYYKQHGEHYL